MKNDIRLINANVRKKQTRSLISEQFNELIRFMKIKRFEQFFFKIHHNKCDSGWCN